MRLQARTCFQSHKELFIICPRSSSPPPSVAFFFSVVPSNLVGNFLLVALLTTFCHGYFSETDCSLAHVLSLSRGCFPLPFCWQGAAGLHRWLGTLGWTDSPSTAGLVPPPLLCKGHGAKSIRENSKLVSVSSSCRDMDSGDSVPPASQVLAVYLIPLFPKRCETEEL